MNRIYRIVFNRSLGLQQVASELASAPGKRGRGQGRLRRLARSIADGLVIPAVMTLGVMLPSMAHASTSLPSSTSGIDLSAYGPAGNPFIVGAGTIISVGGNSLTDGIHGSPANSYMVSNSGRITGGTNAAGIRFEGAGSVTNQGGGFITGGTFGMYLSSLTAASSVTNSGSIRGTGPTSEGIQVSGVGLVTNNASGNIYGTSYGVRLFGTTAPGSTNTVTNTGTITGNQAGVYMQNNGVLTNSGFGAYIRGGRFGVITNTGSFAINNTDGSIVGSNPGSSGIYLVRGGIVTNLGTGHVMGVSAGITGLYSAITVTNGGDIFGLGPSSTAIDLRSGGSVTNRLSAQISGADYGIKADLAAQVTNAGTIHGSLNSVLFGAGNSTLTLQSGSTLEGDAMATGGGNVLALQGNGSSSNVFGGFSTISTTAGTQWVLSGIVSDTGNVLVSTDANSQVNFSGTLQGITSLTKSGTGALLIDGTVLNTGTTDITSGKVIVGSDAAHAAATLQGNVQVENGATLGGHGVLANDVSVATGGHLAPGNSIGTLTVDGNLTLAQGSQLDFELGAPGADARTPGLGDSVSVGGNLTLNGAALNISDAGGLGVGLYNLFSYGGTLTQTNGGIVSPSGYTIQYLTGSKQINLITGGAMVHFWDADGLASPSLLGGGSGVWSQANQNWSDANGSVVTARTPADAFAIFGGAAGTVTVDDVGGSAPVVTQGMQFASDAYVLDGDAIGLVGATPGALSEIRVGDGSAGSVNWLATIQNVLSGAGVDKTGAGTLVLSGNNTYTGGTTVSAGTLQVNSDANLGDASGALTLDGGTLKVVGTAYSGTQRHVTLGGAGGNVDIADAGNRFTVAQSLTGSGSLISSGAGTLVLAGNNIYTGSTTIDAGTLALVGSGSIAFSSSVIDNGTFDIGGTASGASIASLSGSGDVALGSQTLTLTGAAGTFSGVIGGSGALVVNGNATLTGISTYSGGTRVDSGSLSIGNASSIGTGALAMAQGSSVSFGNSFALGNAITLSGDPTVDVAGGVTTELSGVIADGSTSGDLVKTGGGTLLLSGANTFTGGTQVAAGTLDVEGSSASTTTVDGGATLVGSGSIGGLHAVNGSLVSPAGDAVGTLTVNGNAVVEAGSRYQVNVTDTGASDRIHATGTAMLNAGAVVGIAAGTNWSASTRYTIVTADSGVSGAFGSATSNFAFLNPTLSYDANNAYLTLARNVIGFASVGVTPNERATAGAIEALGDTAAPYQRIVTLDAAHALAAFDNLSGASLASSRVAVFDDSHYVRDAIGNHLQGVDTQSKADDQGSVWTSTWGHWGNNDGDLNTGQQSSNGSGLLVGADRNLGTTRLGAVVGHGQLSANSGGNDVHGTSDHAGLYAAADLGPWQWQGGAAHSWYRLQSHRRIDVPGLGTGASGDYDTGVTQAYVDGGYQFTFDRGSLAPYVNLARVWLHQNAMHESGSLADLSVQAGSSSVNYATAGLRGSFTPSPAVELHGSVGYQQAWGDLRSRDTQHFDGAVDSFTVEGVPVARKAAVADVGMRFALRKNVSVDASYHGQFGGQAKDESARLALNVSF